MSTEELNEEFWTQRWNTGTTRWDMGHASPPLTKYMEQIGDKDLRILVPGAGSGHEAEWLWNHGFYNTVVIDIAAPALRTLRSRVPDFPAAQLIHGDFFDHAGTYDLILEQTFFCAIDPRLRPSYVQKMHELLAPNGTLAGLLFDFPLEVGMPGRPPEAPIGPPFGGSAEEYRGLFAPFFHIHTLAPCYNSIPPRAGHELFFILKQKSPHR